MHEQLHEGPASLPRRAPSAHDVHERRRDAQTGTRASNSLVRVGVRLALASALSYEARMRRSVLPLLAFALALPLAPSDARAEEGMWPFNMVPKEHLQKDLGVTLTDAWLDHVRLASVRFNSGGSGSFVSPAGLVLTNHHVASDCISKISSAGHDFLRDGFVAGRDGDEARCPDLELNQLVAIEDVTEKVKAAKKDGMSDADANAAMKGAIAGLQKECSDKTGLRCDVVTLYAGGKYHLYSYKKFTDVRLVFSPEQAIASMGGDVDNFTYPRFDLDMTIVRVYEGGKPYAPAHFLKWSATGPKEGDVVFMSGNPARTNRWSTYAHLERFRDLVLPHQLAQLKKQRAALVAFGKTSSEALRETKKPLHRIENSLKALTGMHGGLKDAALMKKKAADEAALRKSIDGDAATKAAYGSVFDDVAATQKVYAEQIFAKHGALEIDPVDSQLLRAARDLVRLSVERDVPNDKRLAEYGDAGMESLKHRLFSPAAVYGGVEAALVKVWLEQMVHEFGDAAPLVKQLLGGRSPADAAAAIVAGSRLFDVYARRALYEGGKAAVDASSDPAIVAMRAIDADARAIRKRYEDEVEGPMRRHGQRIAEAIFKTRGTSVFPDATFTLRLSIGTVKGYGEGKKKVPWATDYAGLYAHATDQEPFKLPQRWLDKKASLKLDTPFNFVSTNDIIGGNSGSPVVGANGELVGLVFDGNITSLPNRFLYDETTARAVSVDSAGMLEALKNVYGADALVAELTK